MLFSLLLSHSLPGACGGRRCSRRKSTSGVARKARRNRPLAKSTSGVVGLGGEIDLWGCMNHTTPEVDFTTTSPCTPPPCVITYSHLILRCFHFSASAGFPSCFWNTNDHIVSAPLLIVCRTLCKVPNPHIKRNKSY